MSPWFRLHLLQLCGALLLVTVICLLLAAQAAAGPTAPAACTTIPELQGAGLTSPCQGHRDDITGCITGVTATGFFLQDSAGDGDPTTSDGIFAYYFAAWTNPAGLRPGDRVRVSGTVTEYYGTTEFAHRQADPLQVTVTGACDLPAPVPILPYLDPWADPQALYEHVESMRVTLAFHGWVVGPTQRYVSRYPAGDPEAALVDDRSSIPAGSRVFARDYPGYQGITYLSGALGYDLYDFAFGDRVFSGDLRGVLAYQYGKYTLLYENPERLVWELAVHPPPAAPALDRARGDFDICFWNAENLFDHLNDGHGDWGDWAPGWPVSGTAAGEGDYRWKLDRVARVIVGQLGGCVVVGLQEVEGKQQVWDDLAVRASTLAGEGAAWRGYYVESGDPRAISQGFLVREPVQRVGGVLMPVAGEPYAGWTADGALDFVRTPAAGRFRFNAGTPRQVDLWAYNVHFKSKASSSSCTTPDCTDRREREAADLRDILQHHQAAGQYAVAGGDLNDAPGSSPIGILDGPPTHELRATNLWYELAEATRYSYIYNGESQALDHVYVTDLPVGPRPWSRQLYPARVGADYPDRHHASDHDPLRVIYWLPEDEAAQVYLPLVLRAPVPPPTPTRRPTPAPTATATPTATRTPVPPTATATPTQPPAASDLRIETLSYSGRDEYVTIRNYGASSQTLTGWRLVSVVGTQTYYFPGGYALGPGATVRVHTGPDAWGNGGSDLKWTTAYIWNNDGDQAELRDAAGRVVSSRCYGAGCP